MPGRQTMCLKIHRGRHLSVYILCARLVNGRRCRHNKRMFRRMRNSQSQLKCARNFRFSIRPPVWFVLELKAMACILWQAGFCGIRVGEAKHPGPVQIITANVTSMWTHVAEI
eukprot:10338091-Karenia_brevis.AAC.1